MLFHTLMNDDMIFEPHDWHSWDFFHGEAGSFVRDVHVLILVTLQGAKEEKPEATMRRHGDQQRELRI
jgi:hypothetical protein